MKLGFVGNFTAILLFLIFIVVFFSTSAGEEYLFHQTRFLVRVPPPVYKNASTAERFWQFQKFLFPEEDIPDPIPEGIPNFCGLFIISLEKDKSIKINRETYGSLSDLEPLQEKLREIFGYRERNGIIDQKSRQPIKAVMIKAPLSAKYGEVAKIVDALKESGADPIVLQIDCLPQ
jgi:hypothetical protein